MTLTSAFDDGSLRLDGGLTSDFITLQDIEELQIRVNEVVDILHDGTGEGSDFLGWLDPSSMVTDARGPSG